LADKSFKTILLDLSAGGIKFATNESLDIDSQYDLCLKVLNGPSVSCKFEPIRIIKNDDATYTISGRFQKLSNVDKMSLVQFCMRKNIENENR